MFHLGNSGRAFLWSNRVEIMATVYRKTVTKRLLPEEGRQQLDNVGRLTECFGLELRPTKTSRKGA